jgi:hypothetical protein
MLKIKLNEIKFDLTNNNIDLGKKYREDERILQCSLGKK